MEASDRINHSDMVVVENTFNQPRFQAGKIYFLNTQKFSKNSLLVRGHDPEELQAKEGDLLPDGQICVPSPFGTRFKTRLKTLN